METPKEKQNGRCKACDHPRLADSTQGMLRTRLDAMTEAAQDGCIPCSILEQGIKKFVSASLDADMDSVEELRLDFNMSGTRRSLEVHLLGSDISLSFFYSKGTYGQSRSSPFFASYLSCPVKQKPHGCYRLYRNSQLAPQSRQARLQTKPLRGVLNSFKSAVCIMKHVVWKQNRLYPEGYFISGWLQRIRLNYTKVRGKLSGIVP